MGSELRTTVERFWTPLHQNLGNTPSYPYGGAGNKLRHTAFGGRIFQHARLPEAENEQTFICLQLNTDD